MKTRDTAAIFFCLVTLAADPASAQWRTLEGLCFDDFSSESDQSADCFWNGTQLANVVRNLDDLPIPPGTWPTGARRNYSPWNRNFDDVCYLKAVEQSGDKDLRHDESRGICAVRVLLAFGMIGPDGQATGPATLQHVWLGFDDPLARGGLLHEKDGKIVVSWPGPNEPSVVAIPDRIACECQILVEDLR